MRRPISIRLNLTQLDPRFLLGDSVSLHSRYTQTVFQTTLWPCFSFESECCFAFTGVLCQSNLPALLSTNLPHTVISVFSPRGAYCFSNTIKGGLNKEGGLIERGGLF